MATRKTLSPAPRAPVDAYSARESQHVSNYAWGKRSRKTREYCERKARIVCEHFFHELFDEPGGKLALKCAIRFSISFRWYAIPIFCTQISRPLSYGVRISLKASATAVLTRFATRATFVASTKKCFWKPSETLLVSSGRATAMFCHANRQHRRSRCCRHSVSTFSGASDYFFCSRQRSATTARWLFSAYCVCFAALCEFLRRSPETLTWLFPFSTSIYWRWRRICSPM